MLYWRRIFSCYSVCEQSLHCWLRKVEEKQLRRQALLFLQLSSAIKNLDVSDYNYDKDITLPSTQWSLFCPLDATPVLVLNFLVCERICYRCSELNMSDKCDFTFFYLCFASQAQSLCCEYSVIVSTVTTVSMCSCISNLFEAIVS